MCIWDFCCKCLNQDESRPPSSTSNQSGYQSPHVGDQAVHQCGGVGASSTPSPNPASLPDQTETEFIEIIPVTPPRPNRSNKIEVARKLNEEIGRQVSALSDESPEILKKQSAAFRALQSEKDNTLLHRKRNVSCPGKLESPHAVNSPVKNAVKTIICIDCNTPPSDLEITECIPENVENVQIENELVQTTPAVDRDGIGICSCPTTPSTVINLLSPVSIKEEEEEAGPVFEVNNRPWLDSKPEVYLPPEVQVPHYTSLSKLSRSSPDIKYPDVPTSPPAAVLVVVEDYPESEIPLLDEEEMPFSKSGFKKAITRGRNASTSRVRKAFSRGDSRKEDKRFDPKKQVQNVHKVEQRESAVESKVNKHKVLHKTRSFRRQVQGGKAGSSSGDKQSNIDKIAFLATAGLLATSDIPDQNSAEYQQYLDRQILLHSDFLGQNYQERVGKSQESVQIHNQELYNTKYINKEPPGADSRANPRYSSAGDLATVSATSDNPG